MESRKWYEKQFRIVDVLAPEGDEFIKADLADMSKTFGEASFNAQHIEIIDLMNGGSDIAYFRSEKVRMQADLLEPIVRENIKNGIKNLIYVNVHWSGDALIEKHPDWMQKNLQGDFIASGYGTGDLFCVNTGFLDWTKDIIRDLAAYNIDGIFLDGPFFAYKGCFCDSCRRKFKNIYGFELDGNVFEEKQKYLNYMEFKKKSIVQFVEECSVTLKSIKPDAVIYMNSVQLNADKYCSRDNNLTVKHHDILGAEGGFLYNNLRETSFLKPGMAAKLIETQADGKPTVVFIAGRWSPWVRTLLTPAESWIIHAEAVANGANTWYGIHAENYKDAYISEISNMNAFLKKTEDYSAGTHSLAETAIVWSGKTANFYQSSALKTDFTQEQSGQEDKYKSDMAGDFEGWYDILSRLHEPFDIIDDYAVENKDISRYKTIILPNVSCMSDIETEKIEEFVRAGGNLISTYDTSLYDELGKELDKPRLMDIMGIAAIEGRQELPQDHIKFEDNKFTRGVAQSFIPAPNLYQKIVPANGAEACMVYREPQPSVYCNIMPATKYPVVIENKFGKGRSIYFTGNIGLGYFRYQIPEFKLMAKNALRLLAEPKIEIPDTVDSIDISYRSNGSEDSLHVINYTGAMTRPIERILPLTDVKVQIYDTSIEKVYDTKRERDLVVIKKDKYVEVILPELREYEVYVLKK